jgi:hypothetical protein
LLFPTNFVTEKAPGGCSELFRVCRSAAIFAKLCYSTSLGPVPAFLDQPGFW